MKKILFVLSTWLLMGQTGITQTWAPGGFGHFSPQVSFLSLGEFSNGQSNQTQNLTATTMVLGGGGFGRIGRRLMIGGNGFGNIPTDTDLDWDGFGTVGYRTDFNGGFFDLGYIISYQPRSFWFAFAGIGGAGYEVRIDNSNNEAPFFLNESVSVDPGKKRDLETGGWGYELGLSWQKALFDPETQWGGFFLGIDAGFAHFPNMAEWELDGGETLDIARPAAFMPYLRIRFAGGGVVK